MNVDDEDQMSLEEALGAALDEQQQPADKQAPAEGGETQADKEEQARYVREGRRFVKEGGKEGGKEAPAAGAKETPAAKAWRAAWYKDEYGEWDKLPENFRNALRDQERNAQQEIERRGAALKTWDAVNEALKPFEAQLKAQNQDPQQFIGGLVHIYDWLQKDPAQAINWLCQQSLQTDVYGLAQWMYENGQQTQQPDPRDQKIAALEQRLNGFEKAGQSAQRQALNDRISDWAKDKPDFAAVRPYMAALAKQNPGASLDDLYEQARWAHPEVRERILNEREDKRKAELRGKTQAAAAFERGGVVNGADRHKRPTMSLEDEIASILDGTV